MDAGPRFLFWGRCIFVSFLKLTIAIEGEGLINLLNHDYNNRKSVNYNGEVA